MSKKILFLDRDGTLIDEPEDKQVDSLLKFRFKENVIPALLQLQTAGYTLVMVSNQDGLGTTSFEKTYFDLIQNLLLSVLQTQGIYFEAVFICPHVESDNCLCRKPKLGLVMDYLHEGLMDLTHSYVIGDRKTDLQFAKNIGVQGILYEDKKGWLKIANEIIRRPRMAHLQRVTKETNISVTVDLDQCSHIQVQTGIRFFDHMLEQFAKHGGFGLTINLKGDLEIDEHHTVEDTALTLGKAIRRALGDKLGINRYGFLLPMDESIAQVALDLSGRGFFVFKGQFKREKVGELPTELVAHFFRSFSDSLRATLHIMVVGENEHHMIESIFKGVGRALRQAILQQGHDLPSTKGVL